MEASMKERNFRTVDSLRKRNNREQRRLEEKLYSKQGLEANRDSEIIAVSKEQQRIKQELNKIKKTITTTWGILPPRGHEQPRTDRAQQLHVQLEGLLNVNKRPQRPAAKASQPPKPSRRPERNPYRKLDDMPEFQFNGPESETRISSASSDASVRNVDDESSKKVDEEQTTHPSQTKATEVNLVDVNVEGAKDKVAKRLSADKTSVKSNKPLKKTSSTSSSTLAKPVTRDAAGGTTGHGRFLTPIEEQKQEEIATHETEPIPIQPTKKAPAPKLKPKQKARTDSKTDDTGSAFDQNRFNADGSLRTIHKMADFDSRFKEAKKARYIRQKGERKIDKELTVHEIFNN